MAALSMICSCRWTSLGDAAAPSAFIVIYLFIMELKGIILLHISSSFILLGEVFKRICDHLELITVKFSATAVKGKETSLAPWFTKCWVPPMRCQMCVVTLSDCWVWSKTPLQKWQPFPWLQCAWDRDELRDSSLCFQDKGNLTTDLRTQNKVAGWEALDHSVPTSKNPE